MIGFPSVAIWVDEFFFEKLLLVLIVSSSTQISAEDIESDEAIDHHELLDKENSEFLKHLCDSTTTGRMVKK